MIQVSESRHFLQATFMDSEGQEQEFFMVHKVEWGLGDPFSEKIPGDMKIVFYDGNKNPIDDIEPEFVEYQFVLHPKTPEIEKSLSKAETDDIHVLCEHCFTVLEGYFNYYQEELLKKKYKRESII